MAEFSSDSLSYAPLIKGNTYSLKDGESGDIISRLLYVCTQKGIRYKNDPNNNEKKAYIVLIDNGGTEYKNSFLEGTTTYRYYGEIDKEGKCETRHNTIIKKAFDNCLKGIDFPPFLIFFKSENKSKEYGFLGLAKPHINTDGTAGYEKIDFEGKNGASKNYIFDFDIIDTKEFDLRKWIDGLRNGIDDESNRPIEWSGLLPDRIISPPSSQPEPANSEPFRTDNFFEYLKQRGFNYDDDLVIDFLLGMKVKQFMILCGGTGTGKTKLAQLYGEYNRSKIDIVSVGSNWTENRFITGYMNVINKEYVHTSASNHLISANDDSNHHILVLDEMNLSQVERYFSDILSSMESGVKIQINKDNVALKDNLMILGTINMDETTYSISPKVLDRANVLLFQPTNVEQYLSNSEPKPEPKGDIEYLENWKKGLEIRSKKAPEIIDELRKKAPESAKAIQESLIKIQLAMEAMGLPLGYRTIDEIMRFLYVSWNYEKRDQFDNWNRYLDSQILMKVLPKVHGDFRIETGLNMLKDVCTPEGRSKKEIDRMLNTLRNQRYTSFIC